MTLHTANIVSRVGNGARHPLTFARHSIPHRDHPECNEDALLTDPARGLAAVFDGVGLGGHVASRLAVRVLRSGWQHSFPQPALPPTDTAASDLSALLQALVFEANTRILVESAQRAKTQQSYRKTGTTLAISALYRQQQDEHYTMVYAHAGDSRIYHLHDTTLQRLTDDDGYLSIKLHEGVITPDDAWRIDQATSANQLNEIEYSYFERRNGITQALGDDPGPTLHLAHTTLVPGDRVLLCSDGIHDNLTDQEIATLLQEMPRTTAARVIVQHALQRSQEDLHTTLRAKSDDMSAIVITCNYL